MAITRYPPRTVLLGGQDGDHAIIVNDKNAAEPILPGSLVKRFQLAPGVAAFRKNNSAGTWGSKSVALNAPMLNRGITVPWASGEIMEVGILRAGATAWLLIASGAAAVVAGDGLESNGDGTVRKGSTVPLFIALEDTDNSAGALGNPGFVKAEAL